MKVRVTDRIIWILNAGGTVRQLWQNKRDTEHWKTVFDGLYKKSSNDE
ncbi:hypothetical protein [Pseudoalteromonas piscicida]